MKQYLDLLDDVLTNGKQKGDRTGTGTLSVFGRQLRFDLNEGFPLVTTKKIHWKSVVHELLGMISGSQSTKYLDDNNITIWDEGKVNGSVGKLYPYQGRHGGGNIDQLQNAIDLLKNDPDSRRIIVSCGNPNDFKEMVLHPCHFVYQLYSEQKTGDRYLSCHINVRSNDLGLGFPYNVAEYALLTNIIAQITNHKLGELVYTIGDAHIYLNHVDKIKEQLKRKPFHLPEVILNPCIAEIDNFTFDDIQLIDYKSHPRIKMDVSI